MLITHDTRCALDAVVDLVNTAPEDDPAQDALSDVAALADFVRRCRANGTHVVVTGIQPQPRAVMARMGLTDAMPGFSIVEDFAAALALASAGS